MRTSGRNLSPASRQRWVLALTSVASLMVGLDILVVTTALTTIRLRLGASVSELEWIVNAYLSAVLLIAPRARPTSGSVSWRTVTSRRSSMPTSRR